MCTFQNKATVMVCDVAIGRVGSDLEDMLPGDIRFTHLDGAGTLVEADAAVHPGLFGAVVRAAIAEGQQGDGDVLTPGG